MSGFRVGVRAAETRLIRAALVESRNTEKFGPVKNWEESGD